MTKLSVRFTTNQIAQKAKLEFEYGAKLQQQGDLELSIQSYKKAISIKADYIEPLIALAEYYKSQKKWAQAVKYYQRLTVIKPKNSSFQIKLARMLKKKKKIYGAIAAYQEAIELNPNLPIKVYQELEDLLFHKQESSSEAIASHSDQFTINEWFYERFGNALSRDGQIDQAIIAYHKVIGFTPESISALNQLANIYKQLYLKPDWSALKQYRHLEDLVKVYQQVIKLNPNKAEGYFGMGHVFIAQEKWQEAIEYFIETLKINPNWSQVYQSLAYALKRQGNMSLREVGLCYEKAIIPKSIIKKIYDFKKQYFITSQEIAKDLKYLEVKSNFAQQTENSFVITLTNGRAWRNDVDNPHDAVITSSNKLVKEVAGSNSQLLFYLSTLKQPLRFEETVAYLQGYGGNNYYHWMVQVIPQFCLLRQVGIDLDTIEKFAFFRLPIRLPFQKEVFSLLGISRSKVIETHKNPLIEAKKLIVTSPIKAPQKLACDLVRREFLTKKRLKSIEPVSRIYISRKNASNRNVINENQLITLLENFGFRTFCLESMSFLEQVNLFSKAEVIVAPHGAGLTNLIFCQPGIKVIEIFAASYPFMCFQKICGYYSLKHYSLLAEDVDNPQAKRDKRDKHMNVNLNSLVELMKIAEII